MEYSIQALSRLSGVTTRTLRWYDEIGLLKPSRVAESGYRYYGPAEVDRLQDILYYRALGVELARIKRCLDDPSFDRLAALRSHLTALEAERARLEGLIRSVRQTIGAEERKEIMDDKQKFEAFKQRVVDWHQETYGAEARGRYGERGWAGSSRPRWNERWPPALLRRGRTAGRLRRSTAAGSPSPATSTTPPSTGAWPSCMCLTPALPPTMTGLCPAAPGSYGTQ